CQLEGQPVGRDRFVPVLERGERGAQVGMKAPGPRLERDRPAKRRERLGVPAFLVGEQAELVMRLGVIGSLRENLTVDRLRLAESSGVAVLLRQAQRVLNLDLRHRAASPSRRAERYSRP